MFQLGIQRGPYLLAVFVGEATLADYCGAAACIAEVARRDGTSRVLLDLLGVRPRLQDGDHQALGDFLAGAFAGLRVASVVPAAERVRVSERVARAGGVQLKTFTSLPEADVWLRGTAAP